MKSKLDDLKQKLHKEKQSNFFMRKNGDTSSANKNEVDASDINELTAEIDNLKQELGKEREKSVTLQKEVKSF